jgi:hypothetical protein
VRPLTPTNAAPLLLPLHEELIALLRSLGPGDWERPTIAREWRVRDVAAHLLDTDLRRIALLRDGHSASPGRPIEGYDDLVAYLNELNAVWVRAARRLSPRLLVDLLDDAGAHSATLLAALPPHDRATLAVAWAGEAESENWMDVGREYTERWHHQMQVRDALAAERPELVPALLEPRWMEPLLDLSMRALPRAYRGAPAPPGTTVVIDVSGDPRSQSAWTASWTLERDGGAWRLMRGAAPSPRAHVRMDADTAWRLLYNALPPAAARARVQRVGELSLLEPIFAARSVMV